MKTNNNIFCNILLTVVCCILLAGCASNTSPNVYSASELNHAARTVPATIVSIRPVTIDASSGVGGVVGTAAGAVAGSAIGGGTRANILGGIGGAVAGGVIGNAVEKGIHKRQGMQYTMRLAKGSLVTVVQQAEGGFYIGEKVLIIYGTKARIIPA